MKSNVGCAPEPAKRIEVSDAEVGKDELLRVLRQIALSPGSKPADRLRGGGIARQGDWAVPG